MKLLIIGDLHGQKPQIHFKNFEAILSVGDVFNTDFIREIQFDQLMKKRQDPSFQFLPWYEIMGRRKAKEGVRQSLLGAKKLIGFLASFNVPVYIVPGNADLPADPLATWDFMKKDFFGELIQGIDQVKNIHGKIVDLEEFRLIGYGFSYGPEYPQEKGERLSYTRNKLAIKLKKYQSTLGKMNSLFRKAREPVIFLSHNTPYNTPIDRIEAAGSFRYGHHIGSLVARKLIDKFEPRIFIGGHMHEHYGKVQVGKTICLAAGFGAKAITLLETERGLVKGLQFLKN